MYSLGPAPIERGSWLSITMRPVTRPAKHPSPLVAAGDKPQPRRMPTTEFALRAQCWGSRLKSWRDDLVHVGAAVREVVRSHRSGACVDHRQMRRYWQTEGADPPRASGSRAVFPQWLGCHVGGCREVLQPAFRHWIYRTAKGRSRRVSKFVVSGGSNVSKSLWYNDHGLRGIL